MKVKDLIVLLQAYEAQNPNTPVYLLHDECGFYDLTTVDRQHLHRVKAEECGYPRRDDWLTDDVDLTDPKIHKPERFIPESGLLLQ